jgi:ectoine hydroxylase-related dioxygenase (phytanoyl-CoA dioxygenase family)
MGKVLTDAQIEAYRRDGFIHPLRIMPADDAAALRRRFEDLESEIGTEAQSRFKIKAHLPFPWLNELIRNPVMLGAVEDLIGPNILCWGSSFFTKKARDPRFVSWHQDSTYYGLRPAETVTPWVAFSPSTIESGCVRFIPGSHRKGILHHAETRDADNLLMRGQTIGDIDESAAVDVELQPGEISIHHESVVHGSNPNNSDQPRIGLSIHYIAPHVRQTAFEDAKAMVVRGSDTEGHWGADPIAQSDFDSACMAELESEWGRYKSGIGKV